MRQTITMSATPHMTRHVHQCPYELSIDLTVSGLGQNCVEGSCICNAVLPAAPWAQNGPKAMIQQSNLTLQRCQGFDCS